MVPLFMELFPELKDSHDKELTQEIRAYLPGMILPRLYDQILEATVVVETIRTPVPKATMIKDVVPEEEELSKMPPHKMVAV